MQISGGGLDSKWEVSSEASSKSAETERQIIEANAEAIVNVRMAHRADIRRSPSLTNKLLEEQEQLTDHRDLAETLKTLITLERQAYKLDKQEHEELYICGDFWASS